MFNISRSVIEGIKLGHIWKHVKSSHNYKLKRGNKLNEVKVRVIKRMIEQKASAKFISQKFKVNESTYYAIKNGETWKDIF